MLNITQVREKSVAEIYKERGELPEGWKLQPLRQVLAPEKPSKLLASTATEKGKYPFFNSSPKQTKYCDNHNVDGNNIFITSGGDHLFTHHHEGKAAFSSHVWCVKTPNDDALYVEQLFKLINSKLQKHFQGFKLKNLNKKSFLEEEVFLPPVEQQRIVSSIIHKQDNIIIKTQKLLEKISTFKVGIVRSLINGDVVVNLVDNAYTIKTRDPVDTQKLSKVTPVAPVNWNIFKIGDVCKFHHGYAFKTAEFTNDSNGMPVIRNRDISSQAPDVYYLGPTTKRIPVVTKNDIVVSMLGDYRATVWNGPDSLLNQRVLKITSSYPVHFMCEALQSVLSVLSRKASFTTVKNLSSVEFASMEIALPPEQEIIAADRMITDIIHMENKLLKLLDHQKIQKSFLQRNLLSGKFEVTVTNESA